MTTKPSASRRSFIRTAGAALSGPVAVAVASVPRTATAAPSTEDAARLTRLEDLDAIRTVSQALARHINAGESERLAELFADASNAQLDPNLRRVTPFGFGEPDTIDIAVDRQTATARLHADVETEHEVGPDCPVVQMARQQGSGVVRSTGRGVVDMVYVRHEGTWKLQQFRLRST